MPSPSGVLLQLVQEVSQAIDVIAVDLGVILDAVRILGMMRAAVEAGVGSALGIVAAGQVAGIQHAGDARDVDLVTPARCRSKCSFTCSSKDFRNAGGNGDVLVGHGAAGVLRDLQAPLDLANVVGAFIDLGAVGAGQILLEAGQASA